MGCFGGRRLEEILIRQRDELENYFGSINELRAGALAIDKVPPKPAILRAYELVKSTGLPLVEGALMDQPHIWLRQYELVDATKKMWDAINALADAKTQE